MALDESSDVSAFFDAIDQRTRAKRAQTETSVELEARSVLAIAAFATTYIASNDNVADAFIGWLRDLGVSGDLIDDRDAMVSDIAAAAITLTLT